MEGDGVSTKEFELIKGIKAMQVNITVTTETKIKVKSIE